MLSAVLDDEAWNDETESPPTDTSREPLEDLDLIEAPEHLHNSDISRLHRWVLAGAAPQVGARKDGVHYALWYIPMVFCAIRLDKRTCDIPASIRHHPIWLEVAGIPRPPGRCHDFSANAEQHVKDVDTVLRCLREAGVTLNR